MDQKKIKDLVTLMERYKIGKLAYKKDGEEISIERETICNPAPAVQYAPLQQTSVAQTPPSTSQESKYITSPMVGTLYMAASPDSPSFIKEGDVVSPDTVVCIVEAMKVMNEIKAGCSGKIVEVMAKNAQAVEFGTKLFRVFA